MAIVNLIQTVPFPLYFILFSTFTLSTSNSNCKCVHKDRCTIPDPNGSSIIKPRDADAINKCSNVPEHVYCCAIAITVPSRGCGLVSARTIPGFVYGKEDVGSYGEFPWMVKIIDKDNQPIGTGVLIDMKRILTVAHIFDHISPSYNPESISVVIGMRDHVTKIQRIKVHDEYSTTQLHNDIAILHLLKEIDFAEYREKDVGPICLPHGDRSLDGESCTLSVFDRFSNSGYPIIRKKGMKVLGEYYCQDQLRSTELGRGYNLNTNSFMCAGDTGKDACKGDGGSPLITIKEGRGYLIGLVSWGMTNEACSDQGKYPGVYVNVKSYKDWIQWN